MADELNLLPCPFCESPANLLLDEDDCPYVACASCHISQPAHRPGFEHMAIAAWNRRAAPAAAQLDAPEQPKSDFLKHLAESGKAIEGWPAWKTGLWNSGQVAQLDADNLPLDQGEWVGDKTYWSAPELPEGAHCFGGGLPGSAQRKYYPVEQVQKIVAPYAERIRLLELELAGRANSPVIPEGCGRCPRDTPYGPATCGKCIEAEERAQQQSIDTPEFRELLSVFKNSTLGFDYSDTVKALITYIDGRTAGTASEAATGKSSDAGITASTVAWAVTSERGGIHKLSITRESAERKAAVWLKEWPNNGCRVRSLVFGDIAAAPSTQEGA